MPVLYVSDLDGTLLGEDKRPSAATIAAINRLVADGMLFTVASARVDPMRALAGLDIRPPVICMNGAVIRDPATGAVVRDNALPPATARATLAAHLEAGVRPFVHTIDAAGAAHAYHPDLANACERGYVANRASIGDNRFRRVDDVTVALAERVYGLGAIDTLAALAPLRRRLEHDPDLYGHLSPDLDLPEYSWLETFHRDSNKGAAVRFVAEHVGADRVVCFGDNINDVPMFEAADEGYAVAGACPELCAVATATIGAHTDDAVAAFLRALVPA